MLSPVAPKVVFAFIPGGDFATPQHHLGVSYIRASLLSSSEFESTQIVALASAPPAWYVEAIISQSPVLVGFTVYDHNFLATAAISRMVRAKLPRVPIVFGGPTATFSAIACLETCSWVDACVEGEAEAAVPELLSLYRQDGREALPDCVQGVFFRRKGEIGYSGRRPLAGATEGGDACLDVLPSPYLTGILKAGDRAGILTSRGCVFRCTYCNFTAMSRYRIRHFSVSRVLAELEIIARTATADEERFVTFYDDAFAIHLPRGKKILRRIIEANFGLRFGCLVRADLVDDEFIELLARANCTYLSFGLESVSPQVLRRAGKVLPPGASDRTYRKETDYVAAVRQKVALANRLGISTDVSVILGLPGDTVESAQATLDAVRAMSPTYYTHNLLSAYPGTALFDGLGESGLSLEDGGKGPPYVTRCAAPVHELRFDGASKTSRLSLQTTLRVARMLANFHSGGGDLVTTGGGVWSLVSWNSLDGHAPFVHETVAQLGSLLRLDLSGPREVDWRKDAAATAVEHLYYYAADRPVPRFLELTGPVRLQSLREYIINYFPTLAIGPYSSFPAQPRRFAGGTGEPCEIRIASCFRPEDMDLLYHDTVNSATAGAALRGLGDRCDFLMDSCRWSAARCGATNPAGLASDENGCYRLCYAGPAFPFSTPLPQLAGAMREAFEEARRRRGCESCQLDVDCSCCPFPGPLADADFCRMQRAFSARRRAFARGGPLGYTLRFIDARPEEAP
jgi:radical SAM superfamily enzyme YgiQ (UPF0313 family)